MIQPHTLLSLLPRQLSFIPSLVLPLLLPPQPSAPLLSRYALSTRSPCFSRCCVCSGVLRALVLRFLSLSFLFSAVSSVALCFSGPPAVAFALPCWRLFSLYKKRVVSRPGSLITASPLLSQYLSAPFTSPSLRVPFRYSVLFFRLPPRAGGHYPFLFFCWSPCCDPHLETNRRGSSRIFLVSRIHSCHLAVTPGCVVPASFLVSCSSIISSVFYWQWLITRGASWCAYLRFSFL